MSSATLFAAPSVLASARFHHARNELLPAAEAYRQALESDPASRDALLGMSLFARQSNQLQPALRMAEAALVSDRRSALAWANYGDCVLALSQLPTAVEEAQAAYRFALKLDGRVAAAHYGLGNTLALEDKFWAALQSFASAEEFADNIPEFWFATAFALGKLGRHMESVAHYRRAISLRPGFGAAWLNLGIELIADGRIPLATLCYLQALDAARDNTHLEISAHLNLGHLQRSQRKFEEARSSYTRALRLASTAHPRRAEVEVAFTYLHLEQEEFPKAWRHLEAAEALDPGRQCPEIGNARGILLLAQDSAESSSPPPETATPRPETGGARERALEAAIAAFREAEARGHKSAPSNRGNALLRLGRVDEALAAHETALALDPYHPGVRYNLALTQLRAGDFAAGWRNYEIRWQFREVHPQPRRFSQRRWEGERLEASAALLVYGEQGLGDTLQFVRYLRLVAPRLGGARLILEVQPALTRLLVPLVDALAGSHPGVTAHVLAHGDPLPMFTHHCPLMSLPAVFQTTVETIPAPIPYLHPPLAGAGLHARAPSRGQRREERRKVLRVGLNWAGNPSYRADRERSTTLHTFLPLLRIPGIEWISLQKGPAAEEIEAILRRLPEGCALRDACSQDSDLAETARVLTNLDLVITTDTAVAHLAGAMGKRLWLLLPWQSDWRWMQERPTTPWYPTARLFRQSSARNWAELIERVGGELLREAGGSRA